MTPGFQIILASPRGFCAGVVRAIETVKLALQEHGAPVYVLHEIVHNRHVLAELEALGAVFVEHLQEIPPGKICIFSAHGVSVATEERARQLGLRLIDATCPLVSSVHRMVEKYHAEGSDVIIIGHHRHPEVEGTAGRVAGGVHVVASESEAKAVVVNNPERVGYVTQTTLCRDDILGIKNTLTARFTHLQGPRSNICFATENRQNAVRQLAKVCDVIFVVGSKNSSNSNRLKEVAAKAGTPSHLIDDFHDIDMEWLEGVDAVGITAGASAPERLVQQVVAFLQEHGSRGDVRTLEGLEENVRFQPATLCSPRQAP